MEYSTNMKIFDRREKIIELNRENKLTLFEATKNMQAFHHALQGTR